MQDVDRLCSIASIAVHKRVRLCRCCFRWSSIPPSDPANLVLQLIHDLQKKKKEKLSSVDRSRAPDLDRVSKLKSFAALNFVIV